MQNTINCEILGEEHDWEFEIAAFGTQCFKCKNCFEITDILEDSQP